MKIVDEVLSAVASVYTTSKATFVGFRTSTATTSNNYSIFYLMAASYVCCATSRRGKTSIIYKISVSLSAISKCAEWTCKNSFTTNIYIEKSLFLDMDKGPGITSFTSRVGFCPSPLCSPNFKLINSYLKLRFLLSQHRKKSLKTFRKLSFPKGENVHQQNATINFFLLRSSEERKQGFF